MKRWLKLGRRKGGRQDRDGERFSRAEALEARPTVNPLVKQEKTPSGSLVLTYPLALKPWLAHLAERLGLRRSAPLLRKVELDTMGSFTWRHIDGSRRVTDLVELVACSYRLDQQEAEVAVTVFLRELGRRGLIFMLSAAPAEERAASGDDDSSPVK